MENDAKVKRAIFIERSTDIREMFQFVHPAQVLLAINVYACHFYGSMLWNLSWGHPSFPFMEYMCETGLGSPKVDP